MEPRSRSLACSKTYILLAILSISMIAGTIAVLFWNDSYFPKVTKEEPAKEDGLTIREKVENLIKAYGGNPDILPKPKNESAIPKSELEKQLDPKELASSGTTNGNSLRRKRSLPSTQTYKKRVRIDLKDDKSTVSHMKIVLNVPRMFNGTKYLKKDIKSVQRKFLCQDNFMKFSQDIASRYTTYYSQIIHLAKESDSDLQMIFVAVMVPKNQNKRLSYPKIKIEVSKVYASDCSERSKRDVSYNFVDAPEPTKKSFGKVSYGRKLGSSKLMDSAVIPKTSPLVRLLEMGNKFKTDNKIEENEDRIILDKWPVLRSIKVFYATVISEDRMYNFTVEQLTYGIPFQMRYQLTTLVSELNDGTWKLVKTSKRQIQPKDSLDIVLDESISFKIDIAIVQEYHFFLLAFFFLLIIFAACIIGCNWIKTYAISMRPVKK